MSSGEFKRRQPKSVQGRRAMKKMAPKVFEDTKKILFLRGAATSSVVCDALTDLAAITKPFGKKLKKRNAFHPFDGKQHLEFLGHKNDCPLFCFGSDSKKRPHNIVIGRLFDFRVLDMVELGVVAMDRLEVGGTTGQSIGSIGGKPFLVFEGSEFTADPFFVRLKNLLTDYFHGSNETEINFDGVDRAMLFSLRSSNGEDAVVAPSDDCVGTKPQGNKGNAVLCMRHYAVQKAPSSSAAGGVKLVDIGPNFDFDVRRVYFSPPADFKQACRIPKEAMAHLKGAHENVTGDALGNLRGQLHVGTQDVSKLNLRRFAKGAKQPKQQQDGDGEGEVERPRRAREEHDETEKPRKRRRNARAAADESTAPETDI